MDVAEPAGEITRARAGLAALELVALLPADTDGSQLTAEQRDVLAGWCGWGPLAKALDYYSGGPWQDMHQRVTKIFTTGTALNTARNACDTAFYTPRTVVRGMWDLVEALGFTGGTAAELGCGSGRFIAATPAHLQVAWTGVEADKASAMIAGLLHPHAKIIHQRLEKTPLREGAADLVLGNVPFSKQGVYDPNAPKEITSLHGYFLWRALHACRPGGLVCEVTSRWTLDSEGTAERAELARLGVFLGAIRLPGKALAAGGTQAVTDIVVFRRKTSSADRQLDDRWLEPGTVPAGLDTTISPYFQANPQQVLGAMEDRGGKQYGMTLDVVLPDGEDLAVRLDAATQALAAHVVHAGLGWQPRPQAPGPAELELDDGGPDPAADGAFTLHEEEAEDGTVTVTVTQQRDGRHIQVTAAPELVALIRLKDAAVALFAAEADEAMGANARNRIRQAAMRRYQEYIAHYGYLGRSDLTTRPDPDDPDNMIVVRSRPARMGGFREDPDWPTTLAVEEWDDETGSGRPAAILSRNVGARPKRKDHTDDPAEALLLGLDECGQVEPDVIARILQVEPEQVPGLLAGLIWEDPAEPGTWVTADEYLSGNVRDKLAAARTAAEDDPRWAGNVTALEEVQPEDLTPEQINVQLGSPWIPADVVATFVGDLLGVWQHDRDGIEVRYESYTSTWEVRGTTAIRKQPAATLTWGTSRVNAVSLVEDACNGTSPQVYDTIDKTQVKNHAETQLAADKIRDLHEKFAEWAWEDPQRADRLARIYNARFNCTKVRTYDGSLLTFPGLSGAIVPYPSQRDMIWRNVCTGTTLCGHVVGAGKTFIAVGTAMTLRRLGLVRKPAMVVPNHLLEQTCAEARRYYPGAKILMVTREDLTPERRRFFAAKCAARDWDLVVMTHQQWGSLPVHPDIQSAYFCDLLDELDEAMNDPAVAESRATSKMLARKRKKLLARLDELADTPKDGGLTFEQVGIDYAIVDEAHFFKNLQFTARAEGFNTSGSKRADDMLMKLSWLRKTSPDGRAGMLMTGTPISNALSELWVLFRYCAPDLLTAQDLTSFDAWAAQYIRYQTTTEVAPDGGSFRSHRRPRLFVNLPELRSMLWQFADIRTRGDLTLGGPRVTVEHVVVDGPPELGPFTDHLVARADNIRGGKVKPHEDNMLKVCGEGRRAALWLPLAGVQPSGPGKVERCAAQAAQIYHQTKDELYSDPAGAELFHPKPGALQVIFCDLGTPSQYEGGVYDYLRDLLVHAGVSRSRIAFIHDAHTHQARSALFARCRGGDISILIGSTEMMGTGVNIQRRLVAIHELDHPWRPADVEQRHGRGDRPGNENPELLIYRYATKRSFDAYTLQGLERKKRFIDQILVGDPHVREVEAVDNPQVLSYGELKALATGQPLLLMLSEVNSTIARLKNSRSGHKRSLTRMASDQAEEKRAAARWTEAATQLRSIGQRAAEAGDARVLQPDSWAVRARRAEGPEQIAQEITAQLAAARRNRDLTVKLGRYRGCYLTIELGYRKNGPPVLTAELRAWSSERHGTPVSLAGGWNPKTGGTDILEQVDAAIDDTEGRAAACETKAAEALARAEQMTPYLTQTWDGQPELDAALKQREDLEAQIDAQVKDRPKVPQPA
jgi:N12 class adenine-specific DNA methylase